MPDDPHSPKRSILLSKSSVNSRKYLPHKDQTKETFPRLLTHFQGRENVLIPDRSRGVGARRRTSFFARPRRATEREPPLFRVTNRSYAQARQLTGCYN